MDKLWQTLEAKGFPAPSAAGQPGVGLPLHDGSHSYKLPLCLKLDDAAKLTHGGPHRAVYSGKFRADLNCLGSSRALRFLVKGLPICTDLPEIRGILASLLMMQMLVMRRIGRHRRRVIAVRLPPCRAVVQRP